MNLRDLTYFVAVAEHRHFGQAAQACHVSQPALSMQIRKLEEQLGVTLFERRRKHIMLTPIGEDMLTRARTIIQDVDALKTLAQQHQNPLAGTFRLGAFPTLAPYFLPDILPPIREALPDLRLLLTEEKTDVLLSALEDGTLDAALLALPVPDDRLESHILFDDPFLLAVPPDHPLAQAVQVTPDDLHEEQLLLLEDGHCLRAQALDVCHLMQLSEHPDVRATSMETLRQMVASGIGMTLIPQMARKQGDGVVYIPFADPAPSRRIGLVWRPTSPRRPCCRALAEVMGKAAVFLNNDKK